MKLLLPLLCLVAVALASDSPAVDKAVRSGEALKTLNKDGEEVKSADKAIQTDSKKVNQDDTVKVDEAVDKDKMAQMNVLSSSLPWATLIKNNIPTVEAFAQKSNVKPQIFSAFSLADEIAFHQQEGGPSTLTFPDDDLNLVPGDISASQIVPFSNYQTDVMFHFFNESDENDMIGKQLNPRDMARLAKVLNWNPNLQLKVIIHGFTNTIRSDAIQKIKNAYLKTGKYNVIGVDWGKLCPAPWYVTSRVHVAPTGARVGEFIDQLISLNLTQPSRVHVIGHSLGAHVAGIAGKSMNMGKPSRITALDPAGPLFQLTKQDGKVWKTDAEFVDVIHTNAGTLGKTQALGTVDFYVNGGHFQPGCSFDFTGSCSHARSYQLFSYAIEHDNALIAGFCDSLPKKTTPECFLRAAGGATETERMSQSEARTATFGPSTDLQTQPGTYYLVTAGKEPYDSTEIEL